MPEKQRPCILLVDDEDKILEVVTIFLEEDYDITTAKAGDEGLDLFRESAFDLVVSDVRMPGLDSVDFFREVRKLRPGQKFIFVSVASILEDQPDRRRLIEEADGFIGKPYRVPELLKLIERVLA